MHPSTAMLTRQGLMDGLRYLLRGGFYLKRSHQPQTGHTLDPDFMGICVASAADPAMDDYVIAQLQALAIHRVRLDICDDDGLATQQRFCQRLLNHGYKVTLHLIQPLSAAKQMHLTEVQQQWHAFVERILQQFGTQLQAIEIGNTINRKKWSGYTQAGFLQAWAIAFNLAKQYQVTVVGPNIQDFEPLYNISLLNELRTRHQLPDMQSNNLFVERVVEPELYDFRIFKYRWTRFLKYNLIKKARLLQKIGAESGVHRLVSPVAFWAIYRIQRRFPDAAEKQADYVSRYFALLAASGAVHQANWGAMICHREGLIDDGLQDAHYPMLERVAYYKSADGDCRAYQHNPSFAAFKTAAHWLNGATYQGAMATGQGLEIHQFCQHGLRIHMVWTINGRCALLNEIYADTCLRHMQCYHRDGQPLPPPALITESPLYLAWPQEEVIEWHTLNPHLSQTVIHAHMHGQQFFPVHTGDWRGMLMAKNEAEAQQLLAALHPQQLQTPHKAGALRHARNAIWALPDPRQTGQQITVKQPVKMYWHKQWLDRRKPSKALRSWNGAMELMRRGIGTARPLAYFELSDDRSLRQNYFICEYVPHDFAISQAFLAFSQGQASFQGITEDALYHAFARFCLHMHASGIYFRDFSGGNILVSKQGESLRFHLIDTGRLRANSVATPYKYRIADLTRALHKLYWPGRKVFLRMYLAMWGRPISGPLYLPFHLYDLKVRLKRTIGRKGMKKLLRKIKSWTAS